jgi:hypothetical protein
METRMSSRFFDDPRRLAPRRTERVHPGAGAFVLRSPVPCARRTAALQTPYTTPPDRAWSVPELEPR